MQMWPASQPTPIQTVLAGGGQSRTASKYFFKMRMWPARQPTPIQTVLAGVACSTPGTASDFPAAGSSHLSMPTAGSSVPLPRCLVLAPWNTRHVVGHDRQSTIARAPPSSATFLMVKTGACVREAAMARAAACLSSMRFYPAARPPGRARGPPAALPRHVAVCVHTAARLSRRARGPP
jgi:hypothetical protein